MMKKIFRELKPYTFVIILIIGLLFVQALADLSLPDYMSKIVNVGIQQQGVEDTVPKAMRESEYEKLRVFMDDGGKAILEKSYRLIEKDNISKEDEELIDVYPYLKEGNIYLLDELTEEKYEELEKIIAQPLLVTMFMTSEDAETGELKDMMANIPEGMDVFMFIDNLPEEVKKDIFDKIDEAMEEVPDMYSEQGAIRYVFEEYKALGMDVEKMQIDYIIKIGGKMLLIALLVMVTAIVIVGLATRVAAGFARNLRDSVFKKVTQFSNEEFNNFSTASLITRSTNDIQQIQQFTMMTLRMVFFAPILGIGGIMKALETNVSMAWIVGLGVLIILMFVIVLFLFVTPKFKVSQKMVDKLNLVTRESLTGMLVIRAFNNEEHEEEKFKEVNRGLTDITLSISRHMIAMMPGMQLLMNGMMLLIIWVGAKQIEQATIQVGDMMAFMQYAMQIIMSFLMLSMVSIILPRAIVSIQRISELLNQEVIIKDKKDSLDFKDVSGKVTFKDVSFKYPGADDYVLKDINFEAKPGEMTAFIGSTGSGKSTVINLIPRLFDVSEGSVSIDGIDIRDIKIKDLRDSIGYVPQQGMLFSGDIQSNIQYGKNRVADIDGVNKAIEISQAKEFVDNYEKGINTAITQGGINVSGGQRQRLSIARAIASEPEILIFDDSFSALDFKTDKEVRKALKESLGDSTMLVVAQRINTIKDAENIIVLDEGRIVGQGTHRELLKDCKVYQQIARSQLSEEELAYD